MSFNSNRGQTFLILSLLLVSGFIFIVLLFIFCLQHCAFLSENRLFYFDDDAHLLTMLCEFLVERAKNIERSKKAKTDNFFCNFKDPVGLYRSVTV